MNQDEVIARLKQHRDRLRPYSVQALYLFGSVARNEASGTSDVDLLVEFEASAHIGLFDFVRLRRLLGEILGCEVDLVTRDALHPAMKDSILEEAIRAA